MNYVGMTQGELAAALADRSCIVLFRAKPGSAERMPKTPHDVRRPGSRTPLLSGRVESSLGARVRVVDDHGFGGVIDVSDALYLKDPL